MATLKWVTQKCSLIFFIVFFLVIVTSISPITAENSPVPQEEKQIKTIPLKMSGIKARPVNRSYWIALEKDSLANWTGNSILRRIGLLLEISNSNNSKGKGCAVQVSFLLPSGYEDWDIIGINIALPEGEKITFLKSREEVIIPLQIPGDEKILRGLIEKQGQNTFVFQSP